MIVIWDARRRLTISTACNRLDYHASHGEVVWVTGTACGPHVVPESGVPDLSAP
jgi:hypothetical protein